MQVKIIHTVANLTEKPGLSPRTKLIVIRRLCRLLALELNAIYAERRALRRQARKLRNPLPYPVDTGEELERLAEEHQCEVLDSLSRALACLGRLLALDREGIAATLGFDSLCDVLNINPVHRELACREGQTSLRDLAFIAGLEDSAEHDGENWKGPIFLACWLARLELMRENPEHLLADLCAPGAPSSPKRPPKLRIVG
ncbi:hypothetical protein [Azotobacter salinestris]|uniref:hypothetical protein n=1 Tax=Azotobacter salinestris TaxID=69964 RepID=UPI0032DEF389